jgi:hypothetical protein
MTLATFEEFLVQLDYRKGTKNIEIMPSLTSVLHVQEIPLLCKILKLYRVFQKELYNFESL